MSSVSLAVIVPAYNSEATIIRALRSVCAQTKKPDKIIVIDDCSVDGTVELAVTFLRGFSIEWNVVVNDENRGPGFSRNKAMDLSDANLVAFLDADDEWEVDKLEKQVHLFDADPEIFLCGHAYYIEGQCSSKSYGGGIKEVHRFDILRKNYFSTPSVVLRNDSDFRFRESGYYSEDYYLWLKIILSGKKAVYIDEPLFKMYKPAVSKTGLSSNLVSMQRGELENYTLLWRDGCITFLEYFLTCFWSCAKFLRRALIARLGRLCIV